MQTALKYNVPLEQEDAPFRLDVHTVPETCTGNKAHVTFDIAMNVSYTGQRLVSNMVIVQIKMLSGYIPVKSSVKKLEKLGQIQKTEVNINHVLLYLNEVSKDKERSPNRGHDHSIKGIKSRAGPLLFSLSLFFLKARSYKLI
ncbi:pregnancy zone protein-like [Notechis scutatus]|uniref:Pregnancy zone protein-like n=1 Tax=Notechis scutatus TaxID=8663 RepID=A0A6J1W7G5_9SAUR|nr:pregnancy zone protein-like [Notechis scutatus]